MTHLKPKVLCNLRNMAITIFELFPSVNKIHVCLQTIMVCIRDFPRKKLVNIYENSRFGTTRKSVPRFCKKTKPRPNDYYGWKEKLKISFLHSFLISTNGF